MRQPGLTTSRLTLAPALPADGAALWGIWGDPAVRRYLFDDEPVSRARAEEVLAACLAHADQRLGLWTLRRDGEANVLGCVGLLPVGSAAEYAPALAGSIEVLAALAPHFWGQGYADESLRALVDYAFGPLSLTELAGVTDLPNEASHRMLTRLGFVVIDECQGPRYPWRVYRLARPEGP